MQSLINAVKIWWGLQVIDNYTGQYKRVYYSDDPEIAKSCFTTTDQSACISNDKCQWRNALKQCVPKQESLWAIPHSSVINEGYSYDSYRLNQNIFFTKMIVDRDIRILVHGTTTVVHFPTGKITEIDDTIINTVALRVIDYLHENQTVIVCGHSMGCVMAQMVGYQIISRESNLQNLYIVGSAPYQWASRSQVERFDTVFHDRSMFFGSMEKDNGVFHVDLYLYNHPYAEKSAPLTIQSFPLRILSDTESRSIEKLSDLDVSTFQPAPKDKMLLLHNWSTYRPLIKKYLDSNQFGKNNNHKIKRLLKYIETLI